MKPAALGLLANTVLGYMITERECGSAEGAPVIALSGCGCKHHVCDTRGWRKGTIDLA
jgi:hypothetical protein